MKQKTHLPASAHSDERENVRPTAVSRVPRFRSARHLGRVRLRTRLQQPSSKSRMAVFRAFAVEPLFARVYETAGTL